MYSTYRDYHKWPLKFINYLIPLFLYDLGYASGWGIAAKLWRIFSGGTTLR